MNPGCVVQISDESDATLQRGMTGRLIGATVIQDCVLVILDPNEDGLYGGQYWIPITDLIHVPDYQI